MRQSLRNKDRNQVCCCLKISLKQYVYKYFLNANAQFAKGWLAIAKLKPLSLFISLLSILKKAFENVKIVKRKVNVVLA